MGSQGSFTTQRMDESSAIIGPLANDYAKHVLGDTATNNKANRIPLDIQS
jgi:hypothetical protein